MVVPGPPPAPVPRPRARRPLGGCVRGRLRRGPQEDDRDRGRRSRKDTAHPERDSLTRERRSRRRARGPRHRARRAGARRRLRAEGAEGARSAVRGGREPAVRVPGPEDPRRRRRPGTGAARRDRAAARRCGHGALPRHPARHPGRARRSRRRRVVLRLRGQPAVGDGVHGSGEARRLDEGGRCARARDGRGSRPARRAPRPGGAGGSRRAPAEQVVDVRAFLARERQQREFSLEAMVRRVEDLYEELWLASGRRGER